MGFFLSLINNNNNNNNNDDDDDDDGDGDGDDETNYQRNKPYVHVPNGVRETTLFIRVWCRSNNMCVMCTGQFSECGTPPEDLQAQILELSFLIG